MMRLEGEFARLRAALHAVEDEANDILKSFSHLGMLAALSCACRAGN